MAESAGVDAAEGLLPGALDEAEEGRDGLPVPGPLRDVAGLEEGREEDGGGEAGGEVDGGPAVGAGDGEEPGGGGGGGDQGQSHLLVPLEDGWIGGL